MNILLTSIGRRSYLVRYFQEALQGTGKVYAANSVRTIATNIADDFFLAPLIYDEKYIPELLNYCLKNNISMVMSVFDVDLLVLARNRDLFKRHGIKIILADEKAVEICNDKWKSFLFFQQFGLQTPKTFLTIENVLRAITCGDISYPIMIKPRWGMASIGIYIVNNEEELHVLGEKCKKEIMESHLKYESSTTINEGIIIFQEKLEGQEYGLDIINDLDGNYVKTFAKKKIEMRAGETDLGETVSPMPFEKLARCLSHALRHEVILSVDCFMCSDGIYITEMNCRISGHYPLSHLAGVNLPKQILQWVNGEKTDETLLQCKEGLFIAKELIPTIIKLNS
jgi:carbamoyl-phosphate synthase large subunit